MWFKKKKQQDPDQAPLQELLLSEETEQAPAAMPELFAAEGEEAAPAVEPVEEPEVLPEEQMPAEETPVEETVEEAPAQELPAEETPMEEPLLTAEDLALDEIMKEFAGEMQPEDAHAFDDDPVTADTVRLDIPFSILPAIPAVDEAAAEKTAPAETAVTDETVRIDTSVTDETVRIDTPVTDETIRIDTPVTDATVRLDVPVQSRQTEDVTGDTVRFAPVEETEPAAKAVEDFPEGWEPKYEQPMGEYVPPQPIQFRPKSRLRELKRKLVAGPERRYYEISEQGFVKLQFAIIFTFLVAMGSAAVTVCYELGLMNSLRKLAVFTQLFGVLMAALLGTYQLMDGIADIFKKRFSLNSLLVFSFIACLADGVFCLKAQRVPCCAAFSLQVAMSLWGEYNARSTEMGQMDTMRKAVRLDSLVESPDYHDGCTGLLRGEGQVEDFMDHYQERSTKDRVTSIYAVCALLLSMVSGAVAGWLQKSVEFGVQVTAVSLLAAVPGTFFITFTRPMAILEKRLHKLGAVLCGWRQITRLSKRAVMPVRHEDLFPNGSCMLNGVKYYGSRDPDQVVAYAACVVAADGGGLAPLFQQLLASRNGKHYQVENLRLYGNGGIGGEVCGEPVLVGVASFLSSMGVEIPEGTMVSNAVYVSIDGELSGVFAVSLNRSKAAAAGLNTLCSYRGLRPVLVTGDFILTEEFVRSKFGVNTRKISFPEYTVRAELAAREAPQDAPALALMTRDGLAPMAFAVTGARAVRTAARIGLTIHLLGGILGLAIMLLLGIFGKAELLTPVNMLLYQLIWMIPGLLVTEWTRSV